MSCGIHPGASSNSYAPAVRIVTYCSISSYISSAVLKLGRKWLWWPNGCGILPTKREKGKEQPAELWKTRFLAS